LELKIEGMGTYGHVLIQIFSAKTAVCPLSQVGVVTSEDGVAIAETGCHNCGQSVFAAFHFQVNYMDYVPNSEVNNVLNEIINHNRRKQIQSRV
jgi:hypothetical protein